MKIDYHKRLAEFGFSSVEINAIEFCLIRMGVVDCCEHNRPRFVTCYELDADGNINEMRWQKLMTELGFREGAVILAERALGMHDHGGAA